MHCLTVISAIDQGLLTYVWGWQASSLYTTSFPQAPSICQFISFQYLLTDIPKRGVFLLGFLPIGHRCLFDFLLRSIRIHNYTSHVCIELSISSHLYPHSKT